MAGRLSLQTNDLRWQTLLGLTRLGLGPESTGQGGGWRTAGGVAKAMPCHDMTWMAAQSVLVEGMITTGLALRMGSCGAESGTCRRTKIWVIRDVLALSWGPGVGAGCPVRAITRPALKNFPGTESWRREEPVGHASF